MFNKVPSNFDFPQSEKEILDFWEKNRIYEKSLEQRKGAKPFVFYEGPPTANGLPHPGHCLTRAIKDLFPRYKTMTGHDCQRKGGWDTHGLPVEVEVCKELGIHTKEEIEAYGIEKFNRKCLESVFRYTKEWEDMTRRLGFWINLDEAYVTYHKSYVESVWWSLKQLFDAGLLYQGHKIVWWWAQGGTALSAGEVGQGYREVDDPSVYVRFPLVRDERFDALMGSIGVPPVRNAKERQDGVLNQPVTTELDKRRRLLPHWEMGDSTYILTFRLHTGSLSEEERTLVMDACRFWDSQRITLHAAVVMPDHVHLLCTPLEKAEGEWWSIADLMHSIKGYTSKEINRRRGTTGIVWQREYFDRIIRSESDYREKWDYITTNPQRRGLGEDYAWVWVEEEHGTSASSRATDGGDSPPPHRQASASDRGASASRQSDRGASASRRERTEDDSDRRDADAPPVSLLVWTTTPWTLPSNMFAAVHEDIEYALVHDEIDGERLIFAKALVEPIAKKLKAKDRWKIERTFKGSELVGLRYEPPFDCYAEQLVVPTAKGDWVSEPDEIHMPDKGWQPPPQNLHAVKLSDLRVPLKNGGEETVSWRVLAADFVTLDAGTGLVHEAPAFGEVDFELLQEERHLFINPHAVPLLCAVAPNGKFNNEAPEEYRGRWVKDCDKDICKDMKQRGILVFQEQYRHDYPFCWRADQDPLIQYPRMGWFIRTTQFKDDMLANNRHIHWLPDHIKTGRFGKFLESNVDWSLSRERYWGTPLPIWVCQNDTCGHKEAIDSYDALVAKPGVGGLEVWEAAKRQSPDLSEHLKVHKPYIDAITYDCPKCAKRSAPDPQASSLKPHAPPLKPQPTGRMKRVPEVIDCWYDSGAMPFAQWGFPHTGREQFAAQFPADFISEALDQTRGWFYSLTAISVLLFGENGIAKSCQPSAVSHQLSAVGRQPQISPLDKGGQRGVLSSDLASEESMPTTNTRNSQLATRNSELETRNYPMPFQTCIVLGLLMGEDGLKMSKQKKNYKDPSYIFDHEGADAMRWLFFSGQTPWTSIRFQESAIAEGQREFLIRLYNCYSFFVIYANIDKWTPSLGLHGHADNSSPPSKGGAGGGSHASFSDLDRWINSELAHCCATVFRAMEAYDNYNAARALSDFVDALSNWYVRRSRDRFWRSAMDADKRAAYETLYNCLVTVTKLIAPFTPFVAESMYQNLVRTHDDNAPQSVHLCDYPVTEATQDKIEGGIDAKLNQEINRVRQLVSCGRAARSASKLRVRQPLAAIELFHREADVIRRYEDIIKDELNVKRIDYVTNAEIDKYVHYEVKPDFKVLGPKHGPLAPKIKAALVKHPNPDEIVRQLEQEGAYTLNVEGQQVELGPAEIRVELHAREGFAAERIPGQGIIVLDTHITPELQDEGWARDLVNQVQQIRKKLDLRYEQRIDLAIIGDDDVARVVNAHAEYIRGETLAQTLLNQTIGGAELVKVDIGGHVAEISVKPV